MATKNHKVNFDINAQDRASQAFNSVKRAMGEAEAAGQKLRGVLGTLGVGVSVGAIATALVRETREAEQASNRLNAVIRASGQNAGIARKEFDELADSMQSMFGFSDEQVKKAQATLLKFGNIQGDVFRDGLRLSADLAAFMGSDIPEAAQMIGKSLQSPTEGLTLMERQFGKLTAEQEKHIESLVKQGKTIEAQNAVIDLWQQKIGGTAELMNTGLTKSLNDVTNAWSDMLEVMGETDVFQSVAKSGLGFVEQSLKDIKEIVENGDWIEKTLALAAFAGGWRDFKLTPAETVLRDELAALEKGKKLMQGLVGYEAAIADADRRISEIRKTLETKYKPTELVSGFDHPSTRAAFNPPQLGGGKDDSAERARLAREALREEEFRLQKAVELEEMASQDRIEASQALANAAIADEQRRQKEIQRTTEAMVESAQISTQLAESMVYTWDAAGNRIELTREAFEEMEEQTRKLAGAGQELGWAFQSAFEDAVLEGEKLSKVLQSLAKDIARLVLRTTVTDPIGRAIAGAIGSGFGGARAGGGPVSAGVGYLVGERGPELFVPNSAGSIAANDKLGGVNIHNEVVINGNGVTRHEVQAALTASEKRTIAAVRELRAR